VYESADILLRAIEIVTGVSNSIGALLGDRTLSL
jgi:hypothetical protein